MALAYGQPATMFYEIPSIRGRGEIQCTKGFRVTRSFLDLSKFEFLSNRFFIRSRGVQSTVVNCPG